MLSLTPPVVHLDIAAFTKIHDASDANEGWHAHRLHVGTWKVLEARAVQSLTKQRSSMMDRVLGRKPDISPVDILEWARRATSNTNLFPPEQDLAQRKRLHPAMARMDEEEARRHVVEATDIRVTQGLVFAAMSAAAVSACQKRRDVDVAAFARSVDAVESALADRRFTGFWDAVNEATSAAARAVTGDRALARIASWWSSDMPKPEPAQWSEWLIYMRHAADDGVPMAKVPVPLSAGVSGMTAAVPIGNHENFRNMVSWGRSLLVTGDQKYPLLRTERPLVAMADAERAALMADAHERLSRALLAADKDYELAMVGQQYRLRETIVESTLRLEQAIGRMGTMLAAQMRSNAAMLGARIAANTAAVQDAAASASAGNARLVGAVQQAADRIDVSLQRIPTGWRVA